MDDKVACALAGLICVTSIELLALYKGVDGTYLSVVVAAVCTIIGLVFGVTIGKKEASSTVQEP